VRAPGSNSFFLGPWPQKKRRGGEKKGREIEPFALRSSRRRTSKEYLGKKKGEKIGRGREGGEGGTPPRPHFLFLQHIT